MTDITAAGLPLRNVISKEAAQWQATLAKEPTAGSVLICSSLGGYGSLIDHDSLVGAALRIRRAAVSYLLCDGILSACELCTYRTVPVHEFLQIGQQDRLCGERCFGFGMDSLSFLKLPIHRYSSFLEKRDYVEAEEFAASLKSVEEMKAFCLDGINLGEDAYAGALRYLAKGYVEDDADGVAIFRRYITAAALTCRMTQRLIAAIQPGIMLFHHGMYVPQGVIGKVARQQGIRAINYSLTYRQGTFIYSHDECYQKTLLVEPVSVWRDKELSDKENARLDSYLHSRRYGSQDWIKYNPNPKEDREAIVSELGLDERPMILVLTNVISDAQLFYRNVCFDSIIDWLIATVHYFAQRPDLQAVIRVHPAEITAPVRTRRPIMETVRERIASMPDNVRVVDADNTISTYTLAEMADCAVIYGTKAGVELPALGTPVIVAGEAWVRNKGITMDACSAEGYLALLARLPMKERLSPAHVEVARRYFHHYYFRRSIPIKALLTPPSRRTPTRSWVVKFHAWKERYLPKEAQWLLRQARRRVVSNQIGPPVFQSVLAQRLHSLEELEPNQDVGLDTICKGILQGGDFIYDEPD